MKIEDIINKHYKKFYKKTVNSNIAISQGRTPEDILHDVLYTALKKYKDADADENEVVNYIGKTLYTEKHFQYARKKNEIVIFTDVLPEI